MYRHTYRHREKPSSFLCGSLRDVTLVTVFCGDYLAESVKLTLTSRVTKLWGPSGCNALGPQRYAFLSTSLPSLAQTYRPTGCS